MISKGSFLFPRVPSLPAAAGLGRTFVLTTDGHVYQEQASSWDDISASSSIAASGTKVSALTAATALALADSFPIVQSGASKQATVQMLATLLGNTLNSVSLADQTINAAASAALAGSTINIPANKLRAGTVLKFKISVAKTAAGTASNAFVFRLGTSGTTSDAAILTFNLPVGTAVADQANVEIVVTIRSIGATAVAQGFLTLTHNLSTTGFATVPAVNLKATSGSFDSTIANLIASLSCTTAAATVLTFSQVIAEAINL